MAKKIQFITHYSDMYGANRSFLTLINHFANLEDFEISVLLPSRGSMTVELEKRSIKYQIFPFFGLFLYLRFKTKYLAVPFLWIYNFFIFPFLFFKIKRENPNLIYSNTSAENLGIFLSKSLKIKHISHVREFMSLDYHAYFIFGKKLKKRFLELSDGLILVSKAVKKHLTYGSDFNILNEVIYNGLDVSSDPLCEIPIPNEINFGVVGLIDPAKGHLMALEYYNKILEVLPNSKLHFYGDGNSNYYKNVVKYVHKKNLLDKVVFHGFVKDMNEIYTFDVLLMFSRAEGFGRVTVEAILRGIPVIGYDSAGTAELINHGETGYLFKDYDSFKANLQNLLQSNTNYNRIRFNAREIMEKNCSESVYSISVERFVRKVLSL